MCAVVIAAFVINLTCFVVAVLNLSSGEPHSSSNCQRSYRSSLGGTDSVIGHRMHSNQWRHYYQGSEDAEVQMGPKRGDRDGDVASQLVRSAETLDNLCEHWQVTVQHASTVSVVITDRQKRTFPPPRLFTGAAAAVMDQGRFLFISA